MILMILMKNELKEWIKDMKSIRENNFENLIFRNLFLEWAISKMFFERINFWKSNLENVYFESTKCGLTDCVQFLLRGFYYIF